MTEVRRDEQGRRGFRTAAWLLTMLAVPLMACTQITKDEGALIQSRFTPLPFGISSPRADSPQGVENASKITQTLAEKPARGRGPGPREIPLFWGAPEGRAFLAAPRPRAFALGDPARICPARVAAAGGQDVADAAAAALRGCFDDLARADAPAECGCRIVAADDALTAPVEDFAYAPGVSTWIKAPGLGLDLLLAAHETVSPTGARRLEMVTGPGLSITADLARDGAAEMRIDRAGRPPLVLTGTHRPEGLRRGRFAERAWLSDPEGRNAILLSGYEPLEFAMRRKQLLSTK